MAETLQIPFRIRTNGSVGTIDSLADEAVDQDISAAVLTHVGERLLFPAFGIPDPAFSTIDADRLAACLAAYGPKVRVSGVVTTLQTSDFQEVQVTWDRGANGKS